MDVVCVSEDTYLCKILDTEARAMEIPLTCSLSPAEVKAPAAYIIDTTYQTHHSWGENCSKALIFNKLPDVPTLLKLKNESVNFLVGKPMGSDEAHYLLTKLCQIPNRLEPVCDWLSEIPDKLMEDYYKLAFARLTQVHSLIDMVKEHHSEKAWEELKGVVHKIAGGAGLYGRFMASEICKELESKIKHKDFETIDLNLFYRQLYLYIQ